MIHSCTPRTVSLCGTVAFLLSRGLAQAPSVGGSAPPTPTMGQQPLVIQSGHSSTVSSIALSHDGKLLLTGGVDRVVQLWDVRSGRVIRSFVGHSGSVTSVAVSPDDRYA